MSTNEQAFADHFSAQASEYAAFRPRYPDELFAYLASLAPAQRLAVDCGTGSGQAAAGLAAHFKEVVGVDPSAAQIAHAAPHDRVRYVVAAAEQTGIPDHTVDLVLCAQSMHWFDFDRFERELRRILRPNGVIAAVTYGHSEISPEIDGLLRSYFSDTLAGFWPERIRLIEDEYRSLPFPYDEVTPPEFAINASLTLDEMIGFLASWSATRAYIAERGSDPLVSLRERLAPHWGDTARPVRWKLSMRVGRVG